MLLSGGEISTGETVEADICIIGAGIAGLTLAKSLAAVGVSVCLLESGKVEEDPSIADLSEGESGGLRYEQLAAGRYRRLGGCSHLWNIELGEGEVGPRLQAMAAIDFEERDWLPDSGWPFDRRTMNRFYASAKRLLGLGEINEAPEEWSDAEHPLLPFTGERVETTIFRFMRRDLFAREFPNEVSQSSTVRLIVDATVVDLEPKQGSFDVARVKATTAKGHHFHVAARTFVLAAGATENARLLLASRAAHPKGLGNQHDVVGRYFMEHPHFCAGWIVPRDRRRLRSLALYRIHRRRGYPVMAKLRLSESTLREERLLNYCVGLRPVWRAVPGEGVRSLQRVRDVVKGEEGGFRSLASELKRLASDSPGVARYGLQRLQAKLGGPRHPNVIKLNAMTEQSPNRDSRITLSDRRDSLGQQRVRLDWRLEHVDLASIERSTKILADEVQRSGLGTLMPESIDSETFEGVAGGWHHMGTTRMHHDPRKGVVDENSRVHGSANLYVAGSSVFPTAGYANPTLTIVALALRLAGHLQREREVARLAQVNA